jgi:hypothetical protein
MNVRPQIDYPHDMLLSINGINFEVHRFIIDNKTTLKVSSVNAGIPVITINIADLEDNVSDTVDKYVLPILYEEYINVKMDELIPESIIVSFKKIYKSMLITNRRSIRLFEKVLSIHEGCIQKSESESIHEGCIRRSESEDFNDGSSQGFCDLESNESCSLTKYGGSSRSSDKEKIASPETVLNKKAILNKKKTRSKCS